MPNLYVIAGCNGAGKTTASYSLLPEILNCKEFVNADEIAQGLSPFQPETVAFEAGRIMLNRIRDLLSQEADFAFETTLSTKSYLPLLKEAHLMGYSIILFFLWLDTIHLAKTRVAERVAKGGHSISGNIIERRYYRGLKNLSKFISITDRWIIADNSGDGMTLIAEGGVSVDNTIYNEEIWTKIQTYYQ